MKAKGYDEPAAVDILDRLPLARAITEVISTTPPEFGSRVGLFGEWGSGKTSVLRFVRELLEVRGHIVVEFSPWGVSDPTELAMKLGQLLIQQFEARGRKPGSWLSRSKFKYAKGIKMVFRVGGDLATRAPVGGVAPLLDAVKSLLLATQAQLAAFAQAQGNERIVVMIDDLDRADPRLVPPILFALRELFDVPRFSWILAIDPAVVRAALSAHHPGFSLGRDFLEKIVDFPFILGPPTPANRVALIERDIAEFGVPIDISALRELGDMLPGNPRELRAIVRQLRSIAPSVVRLSPDEIDERLLLALVTIHTAAPILLKKIVETPEVLSKLTGLRIFDGERRESAEKEAHEQIQRLLDEADVRNDDKDRMRALLLHLGDGGYWFAESVTQAAQVLYTSPVVTARDAVRAMREAAVASTLGLWVDRFSAEHRRVPRDVRRALYRQFVARHGSAMDRAANVFSDRDLQETVDEVVEIVRVLDMLLFEMGTVSEVGAEGFQELHQSCARWAHFASPQYLVARTAERRLLMRFAQSSEIDPIETLGQFNPTEGLLRFSGLEDDARMRLYVDLLAVLESRVTEAFIARLDQPNAVASIRTWCAAGDYLLSGRGRFWTMEYRPQLRRVLTADLSSARSDNAKDLLTKAMALPDSARRPILGDHDLVQLLWQTATAVVPQMRRFSSFGELRTAVTTVGGRQLAEPPWWQTKFAEFQASGGKVVSRDQNGPESGPEAENEAASADPEAVAPEST